MAKCYCFSSDGYVGDPELAGHEQFLASANSVGDGTLSARSPQLSLAAQSPLRA